MSTQATDQLIQHLRPQGFLSFAPDFPGIELRQLNVFIGPNGSGKSNLIEAINLLRSSPIDWRDVTRKGGGVTHWVWKGSVDGKASLESILKMPDRTPLLRHSVQFSVESQAFTLDDERVEYQHPKHGEEKPFFFYHYLNGHPMVNQKDNGTRRLARDTVEPNLSILAQRRDPELYPELAWLAKSYDSIRIYREWAFGRNAPFRVPQQADSRNDILEEDFSNLGMFLNRLKCNRQIEMSVEYAK